MKKTVLFSLLFKILFLSAQEKVVPVFKDGEAQIVAAFKNSEDWLRHDLWVARVDGCFYNEIYSASARS